MRFASRCIALAAFVAILATPPSLHAQQTGGPPPTPNFCFGSGSCSIPDPYVLTNTNAGGTITLAFTASARFSGGTSGATVTNNGANTFFAAPGAPFGGSLASWNFDFEATGSGVASDHYVLLYGLDGSALGSWNLGTDLMDSENLGFGFLSTGVPGIVTPPSGWTAFDPNGQTQYDFVLEAFNSDNVLQTSVIGCVSTTGTSSGCSPGSVTPEPATMSLMAMGLVGMAGTGIRRRRRNKSVS